VVAVSSDGLRKAANHFTSNKYTPTPSSEIISRRLLEFPFFPTIRPTARERKDNEKRETTGRE
jgi:hypothetical protein